MGQSSSTNSDKVNINCPNCMSKGKLPNLAGKFHLINNEECKCNGCGNIYKKDIIYKTDIESNIFDEKDER